jgi:hypothetical protein
MKFTSYQIIKFVQGFIWCCITLFYGLNPCIFVIGILGIFWRLFEWKSAHLGLFSDGPLGLYLYPIMDGYELAANLKNLMVQRVPEDRIPDQGQRWNIFQTQ